jgi:hypothetical protein
VYLTLISAEFPRAIQASQALQVSPRLSQELLKVFDSSVDRRMAAGSTAAVRSSNQLFRSAVTDLTLTSLCCRAPHASEAWSFSRGILPSTSDLKVICYINYFTERCLLSLKPSYMAPGPPSCSFTPSGHRARKTGTTFLTSSTRLAVLPPRVR